MYMVNTGLHTTQGVEGEEHTFEDHIIPGVLLH
jgi:hypothetical protein